MCLVENCWFRLLHKKKPPPLQSLGKSPYRKSRYQYSVVGLSRFSDLPVAVRYHRTCRPDPTLFSTSPHLSASASTKPTVSTVSSLPSLRGFSAWRHWPTSRVKWAGAALCVRSLGASPHVRRPRNGRSTASS